MWKGWLFSRIWNKKQTFLLACLLFSNTHEVWNKQGFLDLNHLSSAQQKHSKSQNHVPCYLQLKLFGKQQKVYLLLEAQCGNDIIKHNEQVQKKRVMLRQFSAFLSLSKISVLRPWWAIHIFKHRKFCGICQCVEKSSEFSHCF